MCERERKKDGKRVESQGIRFNNPFSSARRILLALRYNAENREHSGEKGVRNFARNLRRNVPGVENREQISLPASFSLVVQL